MTVRIAGTSGARPSVHGDRVVGEANTVGQRPVAAPPVQVRPAVDAAKVSLDKPKPRERTSAGKGAKSVKRRTTRTGKKKVA